jgi:enoyl-[acyl-carrier-protein] reductase (NADH)
VRYLASDLGPKSTGQRHLGRRDQTLASAGISGISTMLQAYREKSPLRRGVDTAEVACGGVLLSQAARGVTGRRS